jgi:hypothetical protein
MPQNGKETVKFSTLQGRARHSVRAVRALSSGQLFVSFATFCEICVHLRLSVVALVAVFRFVRRPAVLPGCGVSLVKT